MIVDPVCLLHGIPASQHQGGRCLFCCICFKPLRPDQCATDISGQLWDVCAGQCAFESGIDK